MLEIENLSSGYGSIGVLHGICLKVEAKEIVSIIGANGAGKSTLLRTISSLIRSTGGRIAFEEQDISHLSADKVTKLGLIQVPEGRQLFAPLTVYENLYIGSFATYGRLDKSERAQLYDYVFELFPILANRRKQTAGTLSGGEQQMLAVGRALMGQPKLLLLDEPSLGLAPKIVETIATVLQGLNKKGLSILLVEQNASLALTIATSGYVLDLGRIILQGAASELLQNEKVKEIYLGGV